jgi:hypothetical protein
MSTRINATAQRRYGRPDLDRLIVGALQRTGKERKRNLDEVRIVLAQIVAKKK